MSKHTLKKEIQKELKNLNEMIDRKIIRGVSYRREAHQHKFLLSQLYSLNRRSQKSFYSRLTSAFASFVL